MVLHIRRRGAIYKVTSVARHSIGFTAQVAHTNYGAGTYGPAIPELQLTAVYETADRVHFRLTDALNARYEIPQSVLPFPQPGSRDFPTPGTPGSYDASNASFVVPLPVVGEQLSLAVKRTVDGAAIFDLGELEYSEQFLQLTAAFPVGALDQDGKPQIYGLGEVRCTHTHLLACTDTHAPRSVAVYIHK